MNSNILTKIVIIENAKFNSEVNVIFQSDKVKGKTRNGWLVDKGTATGRETQVNFFTDFTGRYQADHKYGHRQK